MCIELKRSPDHLSAGLSADGIFEAIQPITVSYLSDQGHQEEWILTGTLKLRYLKYTKSVNNVSVGIRVFVLFH